MAIANEAPPADVRGLEEDFEDKPPGPIAVAIIAGGIGDLAFGILTTQPRRTKPSKEWLELEVLVGPLSRKTTFRGAIWFVVWPVLIARLPTYAE